MVTEYAASGAPLPSIAAPLAVTVPSPSHAAAQSAPTGIAVTKGRGLVFKVGKKPAHASVVVATEDGTLAAWSPSVNPANAVTVVNNSAEAVYTGLAETGSGGSVRLFAANFRAGTIDVFNNKFKQLNVTGRFVDHQVPPGFAPFNTQVIGGHLYVSYAMQDATKSDPVLETNNSTVQGYVDIYGLNGRLLHRLEGASLNTPFGMVSVPAGVKGIGGEVLVGNLADRPLLGGINQFRGLTYEQELAAPPAPALRYSM